MPFTENMKTYTTRKQIKKFYKIIFSILAPAIFLHTFFGDKIINSTNWEIIGNTLCIVGVIFMISYLPWAIITSNFFYCPDCKKWTKQKRLEEVPKDSLDVISYKKYKRIFTCKSCKTDWDTGT